jgi:hypothetical protein
MTISANTRLRVVVLLTSVAVALTLLFVIALSGADAADVTVGGDRPSVIHEVRTGDTLWGIAAASAPPGSDLRDAVEDIKRANGLTTSLIHPGQVLVVPVDH